MLISPYLYLCILHSDATVFLQATYVTQTFTTVVLVTYRFSRIITIFDLEALLHRNEEKRCGQNTLELVNMDYCSERWAANDGAPA